MWRRAMSDNAIAKAILCVQTNILTAYNKVPVDKRYGLPCLVAVSKLKPKSMIVEAYKCGQRTFGENYIQELVDKSSDPEILEKCADIRWHFIGHVQSNKVSKLISAPNLYMVETVHSVKLANALNAAWKRSVATDGKEQDGRKLNVMIQVNTSGEPNKNGAEPSSAAELASHILEKCPELEFKGLMTIGALGRSVAPTTDGPNEDFVNLLECRREICDKLHLEENRILLSMGMSSDYRHAIEMGSNSVRIGSTIFGAREKKNVNSTSPDASGSTARTESSNDVLNTFDHINIG